MRNETTDAVRQTPDGVGDGFREKHWFFNPWSAARHPWSPHFGFVDGSILTKFATAETKS